jgi:hypothetical protein
MNSESIMSKFAFLLLSGFVLSATAVTAQDTPEANCEEGDCVDLPGVDDVQNFIPGIVPILGGSGILASGLLGGNNTTSTTSTTSTN